MAEEKDDVELDEDDGDEIESSKKKKGSVIVTAAELIRKKFGRSIDINGAKYLREIQVISTGSIKLDNAIGVMGYPFRAVVEAYGWEGAGKTLMLYLAFAEAQRKFPDKQCVLIDAERQFQFQAKWAQKVGVQVEKLLVLPCSTAEECFDMIHALLLGEHEVDKKTNEVTRVITPGNYSIIGVDSVTQLTSSVDARKGMEETRQRGTQASAIGLGLKKITSAMARADVESDTILFFINQLRKNPNAKFMANPEYRTGGNALPFYDTIAMKIAKVWKSTVRDEKDNVISHDVKVTFEKNKCGSLPSEAIVFTLRHDGTGVDKTKELFDVAMINGMLKEFTIDDKVKYNFVDPSTGKLIDEDIKYFSSRKKFDKIVAENSKIKQMIDNFIKQGKIFTKKDSIKEEVPDAAVDQDGNSSERDDAMAKPEQDEQDSTESSDEEGQSRKEKRKKKLRIRG